MFTMRLPTDSANRRPQSYEIIFCRKLTMSHELQFKRNIKMIDAILMRVHIHVYP